MNDSSSRERTIIPAKWGDIFLYLFGSIGAYFALSLMVGGIYKQINLTVTVLTALLNFLCFAGGVYLFGVRRGKLTWKGMGLQPPKDLLFSLISGAGLTLVVNVIRFVVMLVLILLSGANLDSLSGREEFFNIGLNTWQGVLLNLVGVGVLVPISEELFFRGLVFDWFRQKAPLWAAVLASSLLFGLAHFDSWIVIISTFIMGVALALAYHLTKSIWTAIFIHIFTNSLTILVIVLIEWWGANFPFT